MTKKAAERVSRAVATPESSAISEFRYVEMENTSSLAKTLGLSGPIISGLVVKWKGSDRRYLYVGVSKETAEEAAKVAMTGSIGHFMNDIKKQHLCIKLPVDISITPTS